MKKYQLIHIDIRTTDEIIMDEYDILLIEPQIIVDGSYNYMCLSDRKNTIVELRAMNNEYDYDVLAEMDYKKEVENWFLKNAEREDKNND